MRASASSSASDDCLACFLHTHLEDTDRTEMGRAEGNTFWRVFPDLFDEFFTLYMMNEKSATFEDYWGGGWPYRPL